MFTKLHYESAFTYLLLDSFLGHRVGVLLCIADAVFLAIPCCWTREHWLWYVCVFVCVCVCVCDCLIIAARLIMLVCSLHCEP